MKSIYSCFIEDESWPFMAMKSLLSCLDLNQIMSRKPRGMELNMVPKKLCAMRREESGFRVQHESVTWVELNC